MCTSALLERGVEGKRGVESVLSTSLVIVILYHTNGGSGGIRPSKGEFRSYRSVLVVLAILTIISYS